MKKTKILWPLMLVAGSLAALASCGDGNASQNCDNSGSVSDSIHAHAKADAYSYDENGHYHACKGCEENIRFDYEAHSYVQKDGMNTCSVCGYIQNGDMHTAFATLKKGLNAYANDLTNSYTGTMIQEMLENGKITSGVECEMSSTADVKNAAIYGEQIREMKGYDSAGEVAYSATYSYKEGYGKDDSDKIYHYKHDAEEGDKTRSISDQKMVERFFKDEYTFQDDCVEFINEAKSYEVFQEMLASCAYALDGLRTYNAEQSAKAIDNGIEYSIVLEAETASDYEKMLNGLHYTYTVKNDYLTSMKYEIEITQEYEYGDATGMRMAIDLDISPDFDATLYDKLNKATYTDSGKGDKTSIDVYYGDYSCTSLAANIGVALSKNYYDSVDSTIYGNYYYDKEFTKPYNKEPITGEVEKLYIKPTVKEGDYGKVFVLTEETHADPKGVFADRYDRDVDSVSDVSAGSVFALPYSKDSDGNKIGQMYVDGKLFTEDEFTVEAGKIYIVEYKYTTYLTSPMSLTD